MQPTEQSQATHYNREHSLPVIVSQLTVERLQPADAGGIIHRFNGNVSPVLTKVKQRCLPVIVPQVTGGHLQPADAGSITTHRSLQWKMYCDHFPFMR